MIPYCYGIFTDGIRRAFCGISYAYYGKDLGRSVILLAICESWGYVRSSHLRSVASQVVEAQQSYRELCLTTSHFTA
ncbi:hypothetical protein [Rubritalea tangerina]|uniref:hypothetical protein n=1 Tax=Rubritalea tangerina TaxID=430798 RepID=UPI00360A7487